MIRKPKMIREVTKVRKETIRKLTQFILSRML